MNPVEYQGSESHAQIELSRLKGLSREEADFDDVINFKGIFTFLFEG